MPDFNVIFLDKSFLALEKPAGLLSVPGRGAEKQDSLAARVMAVFPEARVVHRLDMATSGLILMARGKEAQRVLNQQFAERQVGKTYEALVEGELSVANGIVDWPLLCDWPRRPRQIVSFAYGKPARTEYQRLEYDAARNRSRVRLFPHTGRSHQLRVHMQAIGHPILGDEFYATPTGFAAAPRLLLHAASLAFFHPERGERLILTSLVPF
ncbi:MAG: RNA pseudouridine synthase [Zoogloeaceae bacterium]|jgi:tRNA pseudouridine32 synthase/23S rRNA pseudouridine746 synthase|nr:RNA pseudouridine synthase [Zoogloeaceae bacterium]